MATCWNSNCYVDFPLVSAQHFEKQWSRKMIKKVQRLQQGIMSDMSQAVKTVTIRNVIIPHLGKQCRIHEAIDTQGKYLYYC